MTTARTFSQLRWLPGLVAFPVGGVLSRIVAGSIDSVEAAAVGGLVVGAVLGLGQSLASRGLFGAPRAWIAVTAVGYGAGLAAGSSLVDFGTATADLVAMGAVSGLAVGAAQGAMLVAGGRRRLGLVWGSATPVLFALGWAVTSGIGVDVERRHAIFGSSGALAFTVLSGLLLAWLTRDRGAALPVSALGSAL